MGCGGSEVAIGERNAAPSYDGSADISAPPTSDGPADNDGSNADAHPNPARDGSTDTAIDSTIDAVAPGDASPNSCAEAGGRCISAGSVCFGGPTPDDIKRTCGDPTRMVCCAPSSPPGDGSAADGGDAHVVDARPDVRDASTGDGATPNGCVAAGGMCIGPPFGGLSPLDPALINACGDPQVLQCCTPAPMRDGAVPVDAFLGPPCSEAGGTCRPAGGICLHGSLPTTSCGNPDMWTCCAP